MPTPYGPRGGMAFSADELRVLRGALAVALRSSPVSAQQDRDMLQLAEALDEAEREGHRFRAFLLADLARYRAALPGSAVGYLEQLRDALAGGYLPRPDDLAALRTLVRSPAGPAERARRRELLLYCERLAEQAVRARLAVLPGGRWCAPELAEEKPKKDPGKGPKKPSPEPGRKPEPRREPRREPQKPAPARRPVPTPGEVFPPRRRPAKPPEEALSA